MLGPIPRDQIVTHAGERFEKYGCALYTAVALSALIDPGFRVRHGRITFKPWLPPDWNAVGFRLKWRGSTVSVSASHTAATFALSGPDGHREVIVVNGREISLQAGTEVVVDLAGRPQ